MRGASLDLTCLNQERAKCYVAISNLAALFDRKRSINHEALVPSYFVVFLCPEVHHLTFWLFPKWYLSSLWSPAAACIGLWTCCFTCTALTRVHPSAPTSKGAWAVCGPLGFMSPLIVLPLSGPPPSGFSHMKFCSEVHLLQRFPFHRK